LDVLQKHGLLQALFVKPTPTTVSPPVFCLKAEVAKPAAHISTDFPEAIGGKSGRVSNCDSFLWCEDVWQVDRW